MPQSRITNSTVACGFSHFSNFHYIVGSNTCNIKSMKCNILRKTIEGYLDFISSLTLNAIKTELIMHAVHSSRYLQSK